MNKKLLVLTAVLAIVFAVLAACTGTQDGKSATPDSSESLTGLPELDVIIDTVLEGDAADLRLMIEFNKTKCSNADGLGGPPACLEGETEGTTVYVLPFLGPEGHFIRQEEIETWAGLEVTGFYAAYEVSDAVFSDENYPVGDYALVFAGSRTMQTMVTLQVSQGKIVRIDIRYAYPPAIREEDVLQYIVPPKD